MEFLFYSCDMAMSDRNTALAFCLLHVCVKASPRISFPTGKILVDWIAWVSNIIFKNTNLHFIDILSKQDQICKNQPRNNEKKI